VSKNDVFTCDVNEPCIVFIYSDSKEVTGLLRTINVLYEKFPSVFIVIIGVADMDGYDEPSLLRFFGASEQPMFSVTIDGPRYAVDGRFTNVMDQCKRWYKFGAEHSVDFNVNSADLQADSNQVRIGAFYNGHQKSAYFAVIEARWSGDSNSAYAVLSSCNAQQVICPDVDALDEPDGKRFCTGFTHAN